MSEAGPHLATVRRHGKGRAGRNAQRRETAHAEANQCWRNSRERKPGFSIGWIGPCAIRRRLASSDWRGEVHASGRLL